MSDDNMEDMMKNMNDSLLEKQVDMMMESYEIDIDMTAISKRAHAKFEKGRIKMKKKKVFPFIAASLVAVVGLSTVYASDISDFVKSFFNKTEVYSTVVDGAAYYLKEPMPLGDGNSLNVLLYTADRIQMELDYPLIDDKISPLNISATAHDGSVYKPGGYSVDDDRLMLIFWGAEYGSFKPTDNLRFSIGGNEYDVSLAKGTPVAESGELKPAEGSTDYVSIGYKKIENGVQIIPSFVDSDLNLSNIGEPVEEVSKTSFINDENRGTIGSGTSSSAKPLIGYDENGISYEYKRNENAVTFPVTQYLSDAPEGKIKLNIPAITAHYKKTMDKFTLAIPAAGEAAEINREIDLTMQKMILKSIERTSPTTARLVFDVNTDDKPDVILRDADIFSEDVKSGNAVWKDGNCTFDLTFDEELESAELSIGWPKFVIYGNWVLNVE